MSTADLPLHLERVGFARGQRTVIDALDLTLFPGEVVGVLGPNGAGKTTLLRIAAGLLPHYQGSCRLFGNEVRALARRAVARRVAFVPQEALPPEVPFTVREIVLMGRAPHLGLLSIEGPEDERVAREAMAETGVLELADRRIDTLSGGERQRAVLARALAQRADLLLLDEPTVHLDLRHQIDLLRIVHGLAEARGIATLCALHDLSLARAMCDRVVVLSEGRAASVGAPEEALGYDVLARVFGVTPAELEQLRPRRP